VNSGSTVGPAARDEIGWKFIQKTIVVRKDQTARWLTKGRVGGRSTLIMAPLRIRPVAFGWAFAC
jgi:hypothetical protein